MPRDIKENFMKHVSPKETSNETSNETLKLPLKLPCKGYIGHGTEIGVQWHSTMKNYIHENNYSSDNDDDKKECARKIAKGVIDTINGIIPNIKFLKSEFALFGYMTRSDISFWNGKADAIGYYKGNYVIVDWKVVQSSYFHGKNLDVYGSYLHQCLVYARLLQLRLNLQTLPFIMIVLIDGENGDKIYPYMFETYPDECKKLLESYNWSVDEPSTGIEVHCGNLIKPKCSFIEQGEVDDEIPLCKLFKKNAKVSDLRKAFDIPPFHLVNH